MNALLHHLVELCDLYLVPVSDLCTKSQIKLLESGFLLFCSLLVFFLFIGASCLYTFLGYRVGLISGELHQLGSTSNCAWPGNFYKVLVDRDHDQFVWECLSSTGLVVAISVIKYGTKDGNG